MAGVTLGLVVLSGLYLVPSLWLDLLLVALIGALVGLGEIVSRYRDNPGNALWTVPALLYLLLNAAISIDGLSLIYLYDLSIPVPSTERAAALAPSSAGAAAKKAEAAKGEAPKEQASPRANTPAADGQKPAALKPPVRCTRILLAGFAAMALFRSAVFTIRIAGQDVGVGPVLLFQALLAALDAEVDRIRGSSRAVAVARIMEKVDFTKAFVALPSVFVSLLQNPSKQDTDRLTQTLEEISGSAVTERAKVSLLGLALINLGGEELLEKAVAALGEAIRRDPVAPSPPAMAG